MTINNSFLKNVQNLSGLVDNDIIKWNKIGATPEVVIGEVTFPLTPTPREDGKGSIELIPYRTLPTSIPLQELHALPYDKKSSVFAKHKYAIAQSFLKNALHAFAPSANTSNTPVIKTTGDDDGSGRRRLLVKDLIEYSKLLKGLGVIGADLVLSANHVADLQLADQAFALQYHKISSGEIVNMYGFNILQDIGYNPVYNSTTLTKNAYGAASTVNDRDASVVIPRELAFYANGSVSVLYHEPEPRNQQHEISAVSYNTAGLFDSKGSSVIISGDA